MKFSRIYKQTKLLWKSDISIVGGKLLESNGGFFPELNKAWDEAELRAELWSEWHQLMVWAIYCALHKLACESLSIGKETIKLADVDVGYVEWKFSESLFSNTRPTYPRQMRRAYKNDIKP
jgi:hypothetical protein